MVKLGHKFWKKYFQVYDVLNIVIPYQELTDSLIEELEISKGDNVLDAGSGTCNVAVKAVGKGGVVTALDSSVEGLNVCQKKNNSIRIILHNLEDLLPFKDGEFDRIVSNNTIYLINKDKRIILFKEFYRVLKKGGRIVVSDIHKGFSPLKIYKEHIYKYRQKKRIIKLGATFTKLYPEKNKMF